MNSVLHPPIAVAVAASNSSDVKTESSRLTTGRYDRERLMREKGSEPEMQRLIPPHQEHQSGRGQRALNDMLHRQARGRLRHWRGFVSVDTSSESFHVVTTKIEHRHYRLLGRTSIQSSTRQNETISTFTRTELN